MQAELARRGTHVSAVVVDRFAHQLVGQLRQLSRLLGCAQSPCPAAGCRCRSQSAVFSHGDKRTQQVRQLTAGFPAS